MADEQPGLTLFEHLAELRRRLIRSLIVVAATTAIAFIFARQLFDILLFPAPGIEFIFIEVTEMVTTYFKVCLTGGIVLAVPYITYELIMFIAPGLTPREKKYVYLALPWIALMFIGGVVFGYFVLLPPALRFLLNFGSDIAVPQIRIGNYISVVTRLLLAIGLVFELPVVTTFLARLGIISPGFLAGKRKFAIILSFVLAAIITPTVDPINQALVAVPLIILYELSIWLAKLVYKKR